VHAQIASVLFSLRDSVLAHIKRTMPMKSSLRPVDLSVEWPHRELLISMHVRRGDACGRWAKDGDGRITRLFKRPCYKLAVYMQAAAKMRREYGCTTILLATDSADVQKEAVAHYPEYNWIWHDFDREMVGGTEGHDGMSKGLAFIEKREAAGKLNNDVVVTSALGDLQLLSRGDMFIGSSLSVYTRLAFLLIQGRRGPMPPFHFVDAPYCEPRRIWVGGHHAGFRWLQHPCHEPA
jgi:hypothetical protein